MHGEYVGSFARHILGLRNKSGNSTRDAAVVWAKEQIRLGRFVKRSERGPIISYCERVPEHEVELKKLFGRWYEPHRQAQLLKFEAAKRRKLLTR